MAWRNGISGLQSMVRKIPATMATQHPDNASTPFWKKGSAFVSLHEELEECVICLRDLDTDEFMWDWEGKYADEAVIDKLFSNYHTYFKTHVLGRDKFLTFRVPNIGKEKGYSLIRALMVILTSEDFALDLKFKARPLFEVILPMTEHATQLMYIQSSFHKLAQFKSRIFNHRRNQNRDYVELIPLVEGVEDQVRIGSLLSEYSALHKKYFRRKPAYIRPFLARSDPALISGAVSNILANKIALSEIYGFSKKHKVPVYPIIGAGGLVFRGGLNPKAIKRFVSEYGGVRTVTVQSAFRYDYPKSQVKTGLAYLRAHLPHSVPQMMSARDKTAVANMIRKFSKSYQNTVGAIAKDLEPFFKAVPKRRERRQHIGLLAYKRNVGKHPLPRAINFTAALYSIGVPPEFIGLGRTLDALNETEVNLLRTYYRHFKEDMIEAGRYINRENLKMLSVVNKAWISILHDIELVERYLGLTLAPKTTHELLHHNLTSQLFLRRGAQEEMSRLIVETGKLRRSLG